MSDLLIAVFRSADDARAAGAALAALQDAAEVEAEDITVITRGPGGRVILDHSTRAATGLALGGGRWGTLLGLLFLDEAQGLPAAIQNAGLDPRFLHQVSGALDQGGAALGLRVRKLGIDRVATAMAGRPGYLSAIRTRLAPTVEAALKAVQDGLPAKVQAPKP
ncbi:MAG: hypothetical protein B7Z10_11465 [Rhodobacterales bacterium 32-66-7]|nr:MAG: hypothetical protein B7Z31_07255 [Rhodobacterales bacterium 12-65-15]OYX23326.1 MAG: hypothetical protein B7Z10_11465 [Rhodobacterales bacterium 32-66-7]